MLKKLIIGTPLEPLARRMYGLVVPKPAEAVRHDRDTELALAVMRRILPADATCVDIGSHRGEWLAYFQDICPDGKHIAIEPLPGFAKALRANCPAVEVHEVALADQPGVVDFIHAIDLEGWSGLRPQAYPAKTRTETIQVKVQRLDDLLAGRAVEFIKIDVEGAELLALGGGKEAIARSKPLIYFEFAAVHAASYGVTPETLHAFFAQCGLSVKTLNGETLSASGLRSIHDEAARLGYGADAQTNFFAAP